MIPLAMVRAKYPGVRVCTACETREPRGLRPFVAVVIAPSLGLAGFTPAAPRGLSLSDVYRRYWSPGTPSRITKDFFVLTGEPGVVT